MEAAQEKEQRLGRKKFKKLMLWLQKEVRRAKKVKGTSPAKFQSNVERISAALRSALNVLEHRGQKSPARWPRLKKEKKKAA